MSLSPTAGPKGTVTFILTHSQTATLDEIAAALLPFYADWLQCRSEAQIQQMVTRRTAGRQQMTVVNPALINAKEPYKCSREFVRRQYERWQ
jgi:hypothetical protein